MKNRRILFCNYEFPPVGGGGGTCSKYLAKELVRLGHQVEVVTAAFGSLPRDYREGNFRLRRLPCIRRYAGLCQPYEMLSYVAAAVPYLMIRKEPKPDIMASFHSIPSGLVCYPLSLAWKVPHIVLFQGGDVPGWLPGELERMHRRTLWLNRAIVYQSAEAIANSDGLRDLAQKAFPKKKIKALYGGTDTGLYAPPPNKRRDHGGPVRLFFAGRMTTQKGFDTLLKALAKLRQGLDQDWVLIAAGDGPKMDEFRRLAGELSIADNVEFLGFVDRNKVRREYQLADVFVFPSRFEGMSNAVLEAMGTGLPVAGTRIAGTEQLVEDGVNGLLMEMDDVDSLRDNLKRLIEDRDLRLKMGDASRSLTLKHWTWRQRAIEFMEYAEDAIARWGN